MRDDARLLRWMFLPAVVTMLPALIIVALLGYGLSVLPMGGGGAWCLAGMLLMGVVALANGAAQLRVWMRARRVLRTAAPLAITLTLEKACWATYTMEPHPTRYAVALVTPGPSALLPTHTPLPAELLQTGHPRDPMLLRVQGRLLCTEDGEVLRVPDAGADHAGS